MSVALPSDVVPLPVGARPHGVRHEPPRPTLAARLWFGWAAVWTVVLTVVFTPIVLVHSALRPGDRTFKRWAGAWSRGILACAGMRLRVETRAALDPGRPYVFVSNHQNALDVLTTAAGVPHPFGFAAKAELRRAPFIGWVLARTACVFVDKSSPRRAAETIVRSAAHLRAGSSVLLFAEGGRSWGPALGPFQRGAFVLAVEAGVPLVPVTVIGNSGVLDERVRAARPGRVRLVVGAPIPTAGLARAAAAELEVRVRAWMEEELKAAG